MREWQEAYADLVGIRGGSVCVSELELCRMQVGLQFLHKVNQILHARIKSMPCHNEFCCLHLVHCTMQL